MFGNKATQTMLQNKKMPLLSKPTIQRIIVDDDSSWESWKTEEDLQKAINKYLELTEKESLEDIETDAIKNLLFSTETTFTTDLESKVNEIITSKDNDKIKEDFLIKPKSGVKNENELYTTEDEGDGWKFAKDFIVKITYKDEIWMQSNKTSTEPAAGIYNYVKIGGEIWGIEFSLGGHYIASHGGKAVEYAGQMMFENGELILWSNASGHFMPSEEDTDRMELDMNKFKSYKDENRKAY